MNFTDEFIKNFEINGPEKTLNDDLDFVKLWADFENNDKQAIYGKGSGNIHEDISMNCMLAKKIGIESYMPMWGSVVDIGAGYNAISRLLPFSVMYYPFDIIKRTPQTILVSAKKCKIPFSDNSVEGVFTCNVFQHLTEHQRIKYVMEGSRLLKKGCFMFIGTPLDGMFTASRLRYKNRSYAYTGEYFYPVPNLDSISTCLKESNLEFVSITQNAIGFSGIWLRKNE